MRGTRSDLGAGPWGREVRAASRRCRRERCQAGGRAQQACPGLEPALLSPRTLGEAQLPGRHGLCDAGLCSHTTAGSTWEPTETPALAPPCGGLGLLEQAGLASAVARVWGGGTHRASGVCFPAEAPSLSSGSHTGWGQGSDLLGTDVHPAQSGRNNRPSEHGKNASSWNTAAGA